MKISREYINKMVKCQWITLKGTQCTRDPVAGTPFCKQHNDCNARAKKIQKTDLGLQSLGPAQLREIAKFLPTKDVAKLTQASQYLKKGMAQQMEERKRKPKEKIILNQVESEDTILIPDDGHTYKFIIPIYQIRPRYADHWWKTPAVNTFELKSPITSGTFINAMYQTTDSNLKQNAEPMMIGRINAFIPDLLTLVGDHTYELSGVKYVRGVPKPSK